MKTVHLDYTTIITGRIAVEIPDDSTDEYRDAVRLARQSHQHLRTAQFEKVDAPKDDEQEATV